VLIGGNRRNIARVAEYADGWCPGTPQLSDDELRTVVAELRAAADSAGRELSLTAFHVTSADGLTPDSPAVLSPQRFDLLRTLGADRVVVVIPPRRDDALRLIDHYASTFISTGVTV